MSLQQQSFSRRHFCLFCVTGATFAAAGGWLTPVKRSQRRVASSLLSKTALHRPQGQPTACATMSACLKAPEATLQC